MVVPVFGEETRRRMATYSLVFILAARGLDILYGKYLAVIAWYGSGDRMICQSDRGCVDFVEDERGGKRNEISGNPRQLNKDTCNDCELPRVLWHC